MYWINILVGQKTGNQTIRRITISNIDKDIDQEKEGNVS